VTVTDDLPPCPAGPVADLVAAIDAVRIDQELGGASGDPRISVALLRATSALDGLTLRELAATDAYGTCAELGHCSAAALVQASTGGTVHAARSTVRLAARLDGDLRPLGDLLVAGRLSRQHCTAVVHGLRGLDSDVITPALPAICQLALHTDPEQLARELRSRAEAISPELAAQARRRLDARVGISADQTRDGTGHLTGTLHPETLALFQAATDAVVHGDRVEGDTRSVNRRRHDAVHDLLRHAADCTGLDLPSQGGTRAQVTIIATAGTVAGLVGAEPACLLGPEHGLLTRNELLRLLCDADVSTVHLNPDLERLDLSRLTRTVTKAQWRALTARDQQCVVRGCHRRPAQCQAHHVIHWADGGRSDLDNLALLCHAHHHDLHDQQRWLACTHGRTMTAAGWLDPTLRHPPDDPPSRPPDRGPSGCDSPSGGRPSGGGSGRGRPG